MVFHKISSSKKSIG